MSQRQILTGGVKKTGILPAPTVFSEPSTVFFTNRDDTASFSDTEATYTDITGTDPLENLFVSWFAAVSSENGDGVQEFRSDFTASGSKGQDLLARTRLRPRSGHPVKLITASSSVENDNTAYQTTIEQTSAGSPLGSILASGIVGIPYDDLGIDGQDVFSGSFSGPASLNNNDVDTFKTGGDFNIQSTEDYIVFWRYGISANSFDERNVRFSPQIDGVDLHRARTDSTSGGAARTGRGFSYHLGPADAAEQGGNASFGGAAVVPLQNGLRTPRFAASVAENIAATTIVFDEDMLAIRKSMFEQSSITKVTSRVSNTSETHIDTPFEVAINSSKKVMVVFSSSCMSGQSGPEVQLYRENAGGGGGVELIQPIEILGQGNTDFTSVGGTASTDADLLPVYMVYVDDNPGDVVYKVRLGRSSAGSDTNFINVKDDGTDGFEGYLMALELSFGVGTEQGPPTPPSLLQTNSLDFSGSTLFTATPQIVGITDTFSFAIWAKLRTDPSVGGFRNLFHLLPAATSFNAFNIRGASTSNDLNVILNDEVTTRQSKTWNDVMAGNTDTWVHYVITFGGDTGNGANGLKLYINGVDQGAPDTVTNDDAGVYTDTPTRRAVLSQGPSGAWDGLMYSWGIYDTVLTQSAITAMYNGGNARDFDLENNYQGYQAASNLIHYFRLGIGTTVAEFGDDRTAVPSDLTMGGAFTDADLDTDIPL